MKSEERRVKSEVTSGLISQTLLGAAAYSKQLQHRSARYCSRKLSQVRHLAISPLRHCAPSLGVETC